MDPLVRQRPPFELTPRRVGVWAIRTEATTGVIAAYEKFLSPDETARAQRFRFPHLTQGFILARGALRILLACYRGEHPADIRFEYGPKGKPRLVSPRLEFNVSHSGDLVLIAVTSDCPIGVDVEQIRPVADLQDIARRFFSVEEANQLDTLPLAQRELAFFLCWTRKEAYIKAIGEGLSAPLDQFSVSLDADQPARFLRFADPPSETWTLTGLSLDPGYAAAVVYRDAPRELVVSPILDPADLLARTLS